MGVKEKAEMKLIPGGNQMSLIRDTEEILKFLEFAGRKLILNEHAVNCRLTACNNLFSVLNEEEDNAEHILKNLDVLVNRFRNRNTNVQPSTLKVYKSRVKSSIEDFKAWSADPFAWERAVTDKARAQSLERKNHKKKAPKAKEKAATPVEEIVETIVEAAVETPRTNSGARRVSFPIRPDFAVEMTLPPEGLTLKDMKRIGLFLYPYCTDIEPDFRWPN